MVPLPRLFVLLQTTRMAEKWVLFDVSELSDFNHFFSNFHHTEDAEYDGKANSKLPLKYLRGCPFEHYYNWFSRKQSYQGRRRLRNCPGDSQGKVLSVEGPQDYDRCGNPHDHWM